MVNVVYLILIDYTQYQYCTKKNYIKQKLPYVNYWYEVDYFIKYIECMKFNPKSPSKE